MILGVILSAHIGAVASTEATLTKSREVKLVTNPEKDTTGDITASEPSKLAYYATTAPPKMPTAVSPTMKHSHRYDGYKLPQIQSGIVEAT